MSSEPSDAQLHAADDAGDAAAFGTLVHRHRAAVHRYLRSRVSAADAEDAMQQTFLQAWRRAGDLEVEGGARAWLFTVARNAALRIGKQALPQEADEASLDQLGAAAGFAADDAAPDRFARAAEERKALAAALAALPPSDREILTLRGLEQMPGAQVAQMLSLTLPAMKSRLHRARLHLVAELRRRLPEEGSP